MDIRHAVGVKENIDAETLAALRDWQASDHFSDREKAALELTEEIVADDREVSDACFARVREHFSEADVLELVFVIGFQIFASKFAKTFRVAPAGQVCPWRCAKFTSPAPATPARGTRAGPRGEPSAAASRRGVPRARDGAVDRPACRWRSSSAPAPRT